MSKRDIDPIELVELLPTLFMLDVEGAPPRFRVRLLGTGVVRLIGRDNTGRYLDQIIEAKKLAAALGPYLTVVESGRPIAKRGPLVWVDHRNWIETEALFLPVSRSGHSVDMILGSTMEIGRQARLQRVEATRHVEYDQADWGPDFSFGPDTAVPLRAVAAQ